MAKDFDLTEQSMQLAMLDGLKNSVREQLEREIQKAIKPALDSALDAAIASFALSVDSFKNPSPLGYENVVRILVEHKTQHETKPREVVVEHRR